MHVDVELLREVDDQIDVPARVLVAALEPRQPPTMSAPSSSPSQSNPMSPSGRSRLSCGTINAPAAGVAAANDALRPFGATANHTPLTPEWIVAAAAGSRA